MGPWVHGCMEPWIHGHGPMGPPALPCTLPPCLAPSAKKRLPQNFFGRKQIFFPPKRCFSVTGCVFNRILCNNIFLIATSPDQIKLTSSLRASLISSFAAACFISTTPCPSDVRRSSVGRPSDALSGTRYCDHPSCNATGSSYWLQPFTFWDVEYPSLIH